ncbi:hypothetical protein AV530_007751 [Patagioenas fasciata monilis]|uniref:Uncharacterized protein n=1 Tax=Patagioenas fasciata monilis TaxID=372326 RepID=A0A1V4JZ56_PATFA|nr:hypothetical protein AV530_007751 [Patagioenas fasciata monilis]
MFLLLREILPIWIRTGTISIGTRASICFGLSDDYYEEMEATPGNSIWYGHSSWVCVCLGLQVGFAPFQ